jgi:putative ABC transport system ATP-binding protein
VVDDLSYSFDAGKLYSIIGPSGAGKSSLLRLLNRLDEATNGDVIFDGDNIRDLEPWTLRRQIGFLFQSPHLFEGTVRESIAFAEREISVERTERLIKRVRLSQELLNAPIDNLSIGEKQRVALARLLATRPKVALLDEPTSALDPANTEAIEQLIRYIVSEHKITVIMVSHSPQQVMRMGGEALLMTDARLVEHGPAVELISNPQTEAGRRYVNGELA